MPGIPDQIPVRRHFPLLYQQNNSRAAKLKASLLLASLYLSRVMIIDDFPTIRAPTSIISTSPKWELWRKTVLPCIFLVDRVNIIGYGIYRMQDPRNLYIAGFGSVIHVTVSVIIIHGQPEHQRITFRKTLRQLPVP